MRQSKTLTLCLLPLVLAACQPQIENTANTTVSVDVVTIAAQPYYHQARFIGKTAAIHKVDIVPRVSGYLKSRHFIEGEQVSKGELLFEIDPALFEIEILRLEAALKETTADFNIIDQKHKKAITLVKKQALSSLELDQLTAERTSSLAQIDAAKAALSRAELELSYTKITAPFDGIIGASRFSPGALVGPGSQALTQIVSFDSVYVNIQLDEKQHVNNLQEQLIKGRELSAPNFTLQLANGAQYGHQGESNFIDNHMDSLNGSIRFRVKFPNPDNLLIPGQFVTVTSIESQPSSAILIPQLAVQEDQQGRFVLVVNNRNIVEAKYIQVSDRVNDNWLVESGLSGGERVIVEGLQSIKLGMEVDVNQRG
ncbi:efflux RND transporter periplasmic adaptor subunit [Vibrio nomapromontoriensis]|uniref:efflux RND transporter periplasmic adaptor subunit n=1 Tax=Vibrio nomapromontoriensis TaxID=2910246 RepID=UPI003D0D1AED